jgi:predicted nucleic acid-binding Zn ribbon protein
MVEFIIYDLKMYHQEIVKDNHSYDIPLASDLDSVKIDTIQFVTNDQDIPVIEVIDKNDILDMIPSSSTPEVKKTQTVLPIVEKKKVTVDAIKDEPMLETKSDQKVDKKLDVQKVDEIDFSLEEKELLDEKINQIIKKYHKRRRAKRFWTFIILLLIIAILGFVGYSYLYYTIYNPNSLPFGIPVFW